MKSRPVGVMCYICGREYGSASINIHIKTCKKKWIAQEELKPKAKRRPVPTEVVFDGTQNPQEFNETAFRLYKTQTLVPCPGCERTFNPESLEIHLKGCKKGKEINDEKESQELMLKL